MIHSAKLTKIIELLNHLVRACLSYISVSVFPRKKPVTCPNLEEARSQVLSYPSLWSERTLGKRLNLEFLLVL